MNATMTTTKATTRTAVRFARGWNETLEAAWQLSEYQGVNADHSIETYTYGGCTFLRRVSSDLVTAAWND